MRPVHRVSKHDIVIAALPLFHLFGVQVALNLSLLAGATVVILPRFDIDSFVRTVRDFGVTRAEVMPPVVQALATSAGFDASDLASLRVITSGVAPLSPDVARACARRLRCRVKQAYGMTETGGATHLVPDDGPDRLESIGPAVPGFERRVLNPDTGMDLPPGNPDHRRWCSVSACGSRNKVVAFRKGQAERRKE
jgi:acyl-CoA synthetase (AMP-forming)/AMP-acid ligase II